MTNPSVTISLSCNFSFTIQVAVICLGFSWKLSEPVLVATSIIILEILTFWLKRKQDYLGCFCTLLGTGWKSSGTIEAVWDLERAVLRLLKSVLEIQLTKGLSMEQFFPSWPRKSDAGESIKPAGERNQSLKTMFLQESIPIIFLRFSPCKSWAVLRCLCISVIWDALGRLIRLQETCTPLVVIQLELGTCHLHKMSNVYLVDFCLYPLPAECSGVVVRTGQRTEKGSSHDVFLECTAGWRRCATSLPQLLIWKLMVYIAFYGCALQHVAFPYHSCPENVLLALPELWPGEEEAWAHQGMDILWVNRHVDLCLP